MDEKESRFTLKLNRGEYLILAEMLKTLSYKEIAKRRGLAQEFVQQSFASVYKKMTELRPHK